MNLFAFSGILITINSLVMVILMFFRGKQNVHRLWAFFCFSVFIWFIGAYKIANTSDPYIADFWWRITHIGIIFIPVLFTHFVYCFLKIKKFWFLTFVYLLGILFLITNFIDGLFIANMRWVFGQFYYDSPPGPFYIPFTIFFFSLVFYDHFELWRAYRKAIGIQRTQIKYFFFGMGISFAGGGLSFLPVYQIDFYPIFNIAASFYPIIIGYAILRYRLLDIRLVIKWILVYVATFATVLCISGLLFFFGSLYFKETFSLHILWPVGLLLVVSLILFEPCKTLYERLVNRYFFKSLYSYQDTLKRLSKETTSIIDLDKLLSAIVDTVMKSMGLNRVGVLLLDLKDQTREEKNRQRHFQIAQTVGFNEKNGISLVQDNFLTNWLEKNKIPLVFEELEILARSAENQNEQKKFLSLKENMHSIEAGLCLPLIYQKRLFGMIVLGNKISNEAYTQGDLELLETLANQAAVGIQNAQLYNHMEDVVSAQTKDLREKNVQLGELLQQKSEFLTIASHQLRTPTSIAKGMLSMVVDGTVKGKQKDDFVNKSFQGVLRLERIIRDLLSASEMEGEKMRLECNSENITKIVEDIIEERSGLAKQKGLKIEYKKPKKVLPLILGDKMKLGEVVANLLDNAIHYTEKGSIMISYLSCEKEKKLEVHVKDTGVGLSQEDQKKLFQKFSRGEKSALINPNGSGLGLFIVKRIVEACGGSVRAESAGEGKGSEFILSLKIVV